MDRRALLSTLGAAAAAGTAGCVSIGGTPPTPDEFGFRSPAFDDGGTIPMEYTCDGAGRSPPFRFSGLPEPTEAVAPTCRYPHSLANNFDPWLLWGGAPGPAEIPAGAPTPDGVPDLGGARQGRNGIGQVGWLPVCPPPTLGAEEYRFRVYALRRPLDLPGGANQEQFEEEREGAVRAGFRYVGDDARREEGTGAARGR